jgi:hypothetical protein
MDRAHEMTKGQRIDGIGFIGFSNINFAHFWLDHTPEFEVLRGERHLGVRGLGLSDVSERQRRRRVNAMMIMFDEVLSRGGCGSQDQEEAFTILIRNSQFKDKFGDLLESEFGDKYTSVCVFITAGPSTNLFTWGGGGIWEDMCYERRRSEACVDVCVFVCVCV